MQIARRAFVAALLFGCASGKQDARQTAVEQTLAKQGQDIETLTKMMADHIAQERDRQIQAERDRWCKDPQISQFVTNLEQSIEGTCTAEEANQALGAMRKLPCMVAHQNPKEDLNLRPIRLGRLRRLLDTQNLHRSTRVVILVKPAEDTEKGRERAKELAHALKYNIVLKTLSQSRLAAADRAPAPPTQATALSGRSSRGAALATTDIASQEPKEVPISGPFLLPCNLRKDLSQLYNDAHFFPISGEPTLGKPAVVLFVYISDC
jgi:hypothetical protein